MESSRSEIHALEEQFMRFLWATLLGRAWQRRKE
jgi:hypothetical protein